MTSKNFAMKNNTEDRIRMKSDKELNKNVRIAPKLIDSQVHSHPL